MHKRDRQKDFATSVLYKYRCSHLQIKLRQAVLDVFQAVSPVPVGTRSPPTADLWQGEHAVSKCFRENVLLCAGASNFATSVLYEMWCGECEERSSRCRLYGVQVVGSVG